MNHGNKDFIVVNAPKVGLDSPQQTSGTYSQGIKSRRHPRVVHVEINGDQYGGRVYGVIIHFNDGSDSDQILEVIVRPFLVSFDTKSVISITYPPSQGDPIEFKFVVEHEDHLKMLLDFLPRI